MPSNTHLKLDQIKLELLMLARVAASHYKANGEKWRPYNGRRKLKGQFWPINTPRPLIFHQKKKEEEEEEEDFG